MADYKHQLRTIDSAVAEVGSFTRTVSVIRLGDPFRWSDFFFKGSIMVPFKDSVRSFLVIPTTTLLVTKLKNESWSIFQTVFFKGTANIREEWENEGFPLCMSLGMSTRSVDLTIEQAIIILPAMIPVKGIHVTTWCCIQMITRCCSPRFRCSSLLDTIR